MGDKNVDSYQKYSLEEKQVVLDQFCSTMGQDNVLKTCVRVERKIGNIVKQLEKKAFRNDESVMSEKKISSIKQKCSIFESSFDTRSENIPPEENSKAMDETTKPNETHLTTDADFSHVSQPSLLKLSSTYKSTPIRGDESCSQTQFNSNMVFDSSNHPNDTSSSIPKDLRNLLSSSENQSFINDKLIHNSTVSDDTALDPVPSQEQNKSSTIPVKPETSAIDESFTIHAKSLSTDNALSHISEDSPYKSNTNTVTLAPSTSAFSHAEPEPKDMELFDSFELPYELSPAICKLSKFSKTTDKRNSPIFMNISISEEPSIGRKSSIEENVTSDGPIIEHISIFSVKEASYPFHFSCLVHSETAREAATDFYLKNLIECRKLLKQIELALLSAETKQNSRTFFSEIVEAERLLLITSLQLKHFSTRINSLKSFREPCRCSIPRDSLDQKFFRASVTISEIYMILKTHLYRDWISSPSEQEDIRLCAVVHFEKEDEIFCTEAVSISSCVNGSFLKFPGSFSTSRANSDSRITISVYFLKKRFKSKSGVMGFITPKSFRRRVKEKVSPSCEFTSPTTMTRFYVQKSKFKIFGNSEIDMNVGDCVNVSMNCSENSKDLPFLDHFLKVKTSIVPDYAIRMNGFLTVYQKTGGIHTWVRYWSVLNEKSLDLWKFPEDETKMFPLEKIHLDWNIYKRVKKLDLIECYRSNTFEIFLLSSSSTNLLGIDEENDDDSPCYSMKIAADGVDSLNRWIEAFDAHQERYICWYNQKS